MIYLLPLSLLGLLFEVLCAEESEALYLIRGVSVLGHAPAKLLHELDLNV